MQPLDSNLFPNLTNEKSLPQTYFSASLASPARDPAMDLFHDSPMASRKRPASDSPSRGDTPSGETLAKKVRTSAGETAAASSTSAEETAAASSTSADEPPAYMALPRPGVAVEPPSAENIVSATTTAEPIIPYATFSRDMHTAARVSARASSSTLSSRAWFDSHLRVR